MEDLNYSFLLDFFDKIYVLTTKVSERLPFIREHLERVGILKFCKILETNNLGEGFSRESGMYARMGNYGCAASHRLAVQMAQKKGYKNILVLEDDTVFYPNNGELLEKTLKSLLGKDFGYFNFGGVFFNLFYFPRNFPPVALRENEFLVRVKNMSATQSIAYNESGFDSVLLNIPTHDEMTNGQFREYVSRGVAYDMWLSWQENYFTGIRPFTYQKDGDSLIGNNHKNVRDMIEKSYDYISKIGI